jgi:glutamate 5-kinase
MKTWIIKIGSSLIANPLKPINIDNIKKWVYQIKQLRDNGVNVVMVSSGSIAAGMQKLKFKKRPTSVHTLQAIAAVGQTDLIQTYEKIFMVECGIQVAQILLTHYDLYNKRSYHNAKETLKTLFKHQVLPIINENDTVATAEIRFGDNDNLAALSVNLVSANKLVIMTDQNGLYNKNPQYNKDAVIIKKAQATEESLLSYTDGKGCDYSTGGMYTKILAAKLAAKSNCDTHICNGNVEDVLLDIYQNKSVGTVLLA